MRAVLASSLLLAVGSSNGENSFVRYEPLKNKDRVAENEAWAKGSDHYVRSHGLGFEWLNVTTADDVILRIHRLWNPKVIGTKIPVLMLPAVTTDGDIFLMNRPEENFVMNLATQGYDVFLANYRSSRYSTLTKSQYMRSTIDDNAFLDIPPIFDHVLKVTKQPKLHLIGYSKGSTVAMELLANKVEYNDKVRLLVLFSPVSYIETPNPLLGFGMNALKTLIYMGGRPFADLFDTNFFFDVFRKEPMPKMLQSLADTAPGLTRCLVNFLWTGKADCSSELNFDTGLIEKLLTRGWPARTSSRELMQFAQNSKGKAFMSYSNAWLDRDLMAFVFDVYPSTKKYSLRSVRAPVAILQVSVELFSQPEDYRRLRNELCSQIIQGGLSPHKYVFQVGIPNYQHCDPFIGRSSNRIYGDAFYMIMREFDIARDSSLQNVLGYLGADFSHLVPQTCG